VRSPVYACVRGVGRREAQSKRSREIVSKLSVLSLRCATGETMVVYGLNGFKGAGNARRHATNKRCALGCCPREPRYESLPLHLFAKQVFKNLRISFMYCEHPLEYAHHS
jgi:hypothetical protein